MSKPAKSKSSTISSWSSTSKLPNLGSLETIVLSLNDRARDGDATTVGESYQSLLMVARIMAVDFWQVAQRLPALFDRDGLLFKQASLGAPLEEGEEVELAVLPRKVSAGAATRRYSGVFEIHRESEKCFF